MVPVFADPKTDVVFKRIFGDEARKPLLTALLNDLLELKGSHRIRDLEHLSLEQHITVPKSKLPIASVKCTTASGRRFVVGMQILPVESFEKRVIYDASKAYVLQLRDADDYLKLCDVVGVTICNFKLWPKNLAARGYKVPMLSRWRMQEQQSGNKGLRQIQYAFLELPKYRAGKDPKTLIDKWAYFFREAKNFDVIPPSLAEGPFREALEIARKATFTNAEWEEYERSKMAEQDKRGAISLARREGRAEGKASAKVETILVILKARGLTVDDAARAHLEACKGVATLNRWIVRAATAASVDEVFATPKPPAPPAGTTPP